MSGLSYNSLPEGGFQLNDVSHVSFHQKIRRAFLDTGYFRFDGLRCDIEIRQISNVLEIEVNVSTHPKAKKVAIDTWGKIRNRIVDIDWGKDDLDEVTYVKNKHIVHILFCSDMLQKIIT